jgi:ABC-type lipoprotein release transport system permease subunit
MEEIAVVSPSISGAAIAARGEASRSISLTGIDPETYFQIVRVPDYLAAGQLRLSSDDILIGTDLANDIGAQVGDKINALPAGSFALVKVDPNPPLGLEGTVKEVLNDGLYAHDGTKATFLIPSRIHAYKL